MQQSNLPLISSLVSRRIGTSAAVLVLFCVSEDADSGIAVRVYYSPKRVNTRSALAQIFGQVIDFEWDYCEAPLDFGDPGVPVNSPSVGDKLDEIATDLGVEQVLCVMTLTNQGVTLDARDYC